MRDAALPAALLCAAVGLALAFGTRRTWAFGLGGLLAAAVAASALPWPGAWENMLFLGCWISVLLTAATVHLPGGVGPRLAAGLGANAGIWAGALVAIAGDPADLFLALPWSLLCLPAALLQARFRAGVALKVLASWLAAVALLAAALSVSPVTPGYEPDHME